MQGNVTQIIQQAEAELALPISASVVGTSDATATQMFALLDGLGRHLITNHDWQFLEQQANLIGDGTTTLFTLPPDFGRVVNQTLWQTSMRYPMAGPMTPQLWGWLQFGLVTSGPWLRYRILNNQLEVFPAPAAGDEIQFFYISKNWVQNNVLPVTYADRIVFADDIPLFDFTLMIKGVKLKFYEAKGFDTTLLQQEFNGYLDAQKGQTQAAPVINLNNSTSNYLLGYDNVPEGSWIV